MHGMMFTPLLEVWVSLTFPVESFLQDVKAEMKRIHMRMEVSYSTPIDLRLTVMSDKSTRWSLAHFDYLASTIITLQRIHRRHTRRAQRARKKAKAAAAAATVAPAS